MRTAAERATPKPDEVIAFFDGHVHLNDVEMQIRLMGEYGISRAVVTWGRNSTNESLVEAARKYPKKLIPFVSVSPEREKYRKLWESNPKQLLLLLESHLRSGHFKGIGEISVSHFPGNGFPEADFSPKSPAMVGIMRLAEKFEVPIIIHCEITRIREFSELLSEFENVNVIWAHGGYTPYFLASRMLARHPNLHYELSARTWQNHPRSSDYTIFRDSKNIWNQWKRLIEENPERFIVGTDASHHSIERERTKIHSVSLFLSQLSAVARRKVATENLDRLLK